MVRSVVGVLWNALWRAVDNFLQQAKLPEYIITKELWDALKSFKEVDSIMVLPADKGRASIVLDTNTYHAKMSNLIENGPYQLLNKNPTDRLTRKWSESLETQWTSIRGLLQQDQTSTQTAA